MVSWVLNFRVRMLLKRTVNHSGTVWRQGGIAVSPSDFRLGDRRVGGLSPISAVILFPWTRNFTPHFLSTQVYTWVPVNCQVNLPKCNKMRGLGGSCSPVMDYHPIQGKSSNTPSRFMLGTL